MATRDWPSRLAERGEAHRARGLCRQRRTVATQALHLDFAGNDYLGLAGDPRIAEAMARAARRHGAGGRASHLVSGDRKSTRLNSSHVRISYAVFCLKKK